MAVAEDADLRAELVQIKAQLAQVQSAQSAAWLNERRAEEIKGLIREVLADADTRASLLQDGLTAGHDGQHFFLKSNDGAFVLKIKGQIQIRALWDFQSDREVEGAQAPFDEDGLQGAAVAGHPTDEDDFGFQVRRAKITFFGNVPGSKIDYLLQLSTDRTDGNVFMEGIIIGRAINDNWYISGGKQKIPFLREELTSSTKLLAVERGLVTEFFTLDRAEGVQFDYSNNDNVKASFSFNDGADSETTDIGADEVEYAFTARGDYRIMGDWGAQADQTAWQGQDNAAFIGAAVHYQAGDGSNSDVSSSAIANYLAWTVDGSYENGNGASVFASFTGGHTDPDASAAGERDMYGFLIQGAYNIDDKWQPFVRWEWLDQDDSTTAEDTVQAFTFGVNRYVRGHNVKVSADVVWIYDGVSSPNPFGNSITSTGLGTSGWGSAEDDDVIILRTQVQVLF
jgi:hypothetical protein